MNGDATHAYLSAGLKTIAIRGDFPAIQVSQLPQEQRDQLLTIDQWGKEEWLTMNEAFRGATNLTISANDNPDFSQVENIAGMFRECAEVVIGSKSTHWDTSKVITFESMFYHTTKANPDTSNWNTANLERAASMFREAPLAVGDISGWDLSSMGTTGLSNIKKGQ